MSQSNWPYRLAWGLIIGAAVVWVSLFLTGLLSNLKVGFIGLLVLVIFLVILIKIYREQKGDKEGEFYSKHIDK